jgi:ribosomal protein L37AE/L43A
MANQAITDRVHDTQICSFCAKRIIKLASAEVFVDSVMGCEYDVHSSCKTPEKIREFNAACSAYFYGDN